MDSPGPWTELESSPWGQCLNRLCELIIDLDLPEIGGNVWIRDPKQAKTLQLPAVVIGVMQPAHAPEEGTLTAPDLTLAAWVGFMWGSDGGVSAASFATRLLAHHMLFKALAKRSGPFDLEEPGADGVQLLRVTVSPGEASSPEALENNLAAGWLLVQFHTRYPSTSGA